ncbi:molybdopterin molybdotransferase MoeA [Gryllotalpicola daejeonensis]|uniref:Molybdopterin molybdenumtransferase n=1 Tax=Gryllotalpicola daejeonensis TaxID=993087 RepID=A0ABP7ZIL0_9MICO
MFSVAQHLDLVLAQCAPLAPVTAPLTAARGLVLASPVVAAHALPPFDNAAMDGYALRFADVASAAPDAAVSVQVVADVAAGSAADPPLAPGEAARIMTGAPMPTDADTVVPLEETTSGSAFPARGCVDVMRAAREGAHVRRAGEEAQAGAVVLDAGVPLGPRQLAAAAAAGSSEVTVHPAPRVAVFATGDELVTPGAPLARGQLWESNSLLLTELVTAAGGSVTHVELARDEREALRARVATVQASVDLIVITGGVGAGAYDVVRQAFGDVLDFREVAMQPGRPQAFGRVGGGPPMFGLPGNPVAAAVSFEVFVRPAIARLRGLTGETRTFTATAAEGWRVRADRQQYLPVIVDGRLVRPAGAGRSHFVARLAQADAYAVVPPGIGDVRAGDAVTVLKATGDG